jgi:hypothetical protein
MARKLPQFGLSRLGFGKLTKIEFGCHWVSRWLIIAQIAPFPLNIKQNGINVEMTISMELSGSDRF